MYTHLIALALVLSGSLPAEPPLVISISHSEMQRLPLGDWYVATGNRERVSIHVSRETLEAWKRGGFSFPGLAEPLEAITWEMRAGDGGYHTLSELEQSLRSLVDTYPNLGRLVEVGRSVEGRPLWALVLSDHPYEREADETSLRVLGAHHGDEWISFELSLSLGWYLAERYGTDPDITALLDEHEVWIWPVVNPDGVMEASRYNARGVDLNRNYGFTWRPIERSGSAAFSEPETRAVRTLAMARSFHQSVSIHSGATNLGWVWNHTTERSVDEAFFREVAERYLERTTQNGFWVTNGADWYIIAGDTNDWSYARHGGHDYTLEISNQLTPPADRIETIVEHHLEPLSLFLARDGRSGVQGHVLDGLGRPLDAVVRLGEEGWPLSVEPQTGAFTKLGSAGDASLVVEAVGMEPQSVDVVLPSSERHRVVLEPIEEVLLSDSWSRELGLEGGVICIESEALTSLLERGGGLALYRTLTGELEPLDVALEVGGEITASLRPVMASARAMRSGMWSLIPTDEDGLPLSQWPNAVLVGDSTEPTLSVRLMEDSGELIVERTDWPAGTEVELVSSTLERNIWIVEPSWIDGGELSLPIEFASLTTGRWSIRARVAGAWEFSGRVIEVNDGTAAVVAQRECDSGRVIAPTDWVDIQLNSDIGVSGESCACGATGAEAIAWVLLGLIGRVLAVHKRRKELGT